MARAGEKLEYVPSNILDRHAKDLKDEGSYNQTFKL